MTCAFDLPILRPDVELLPGPSDARGAPTYLIFDPLRGTYDKATWVQGQILRLLRTPLTVDRLLRRLAARTPIRVTGDDVRRLCADAAGRGLTVDACVADVHEPTKRTSLLQRIMAGLVYIRIPILKPDDFLTQTLPWVRWLAAHPAMIMYTIVSLLGLVLVVQRFDAYLATFPYFFSVSGAACFALAIVLVKIVHELSHAYVAKAMGTRVPTMGVALIMLFPVAYSDVTDSWRLFRRRQRVLISLAGVMAELVIAGLALCMWALSPGGVVKSTCFVLSSVTVVSTLAVNLNPAMRFDGYYVLSDVLGIDNLLARSYAVARFVLRRHVLGLNVESPEPLVSGRTRTIMFVYALYAWAHRLFLYAAIALLFYHKVTRLVGGVLFVLAMFTFVLRPIATELVSIGTLRRSRGAGSRFALTLILLAMIVFWAACPISRRHAAPAVAVAFSQQTIYAPSDGVIRYLAIQRGDVVEAGQLLLEVESPTMLARSLLAHLEMDRLGLELAIARTDDSRRDELPQKTKEHARAAARDRAMQAVLARSRVCAEISGLVADWPDYVRVGTFVGAGDALGCIDDPASRDVVAYVRHDIVRDLKNGDDVSYYPHAGQTALRGRIAAISPIRATYLVHPCLSSDYGGDLAVAPDERGRPCLVDTYYEVEITLLTPSDNLRDGAPGTVWIRTAPRSHLMDWCRYAWGVLMRESTF